MLLVTDNLFAKYASADKQLKVGEVISVPRYTVSDTRLSYRQVNDLGENKLLDAERKSKAGWRKFSFKELVYVDIVVALKDFGLKREQLRPLWESFFKPHTKGQLELNNKADAEIAIGCVFAGVEMILIADSEGNVTFSDPLHSILPFSTKPQIRIPLNDVVNTLLVKVHLIPVPAQYTLRNLLLNNFKVTTPKESELLNIIRNKGYSAVTVKKKDGVITTVYAEKYKNTGDINAKELEKIVKEESYADITIIKRDGKIVSLKLDETIKL